jgi:hypothetical protein
MPLFHRIWSAIDFTLLGMLLVEGRFQSVIHSRTVAQLSLTPQLWRTRVA